MGKLVNKERMNALKEKKKNFDESRERLPELEAGVHVMTLIEAKAKESGANAKFPGRKMIELVYQDVAKKNKEVHEYLAVEGEEEYVDLHLQKLITRADHLGLPELIDIDSQESLVQYFGKAVNKKLQLAIGVAPSIWEKVTNNKPDWRIQYRAEIAYSGRLQEDLASTFDVAKNTKPLPASEQAKWDRVMGGGENEPEASSDLADIDGDLGEVTQEEPAAEPEKAPVKKAAAAKPKAEEKKSEPVAEAAETEIDFDKLGTLDALGDLDL